MATEADTCRKYVLPKLYAAGWTDDQIGEQRYFTDGRIVTVGQGHYRKPGKRADYLLRYRPHFPLAVVEAKAAYRKAADGLQQAMANAEILGLKFAYSTNGHGIVEHDYTTGKQTALDQFPSPDELWRRLCAAEGIASDKDAEDILFPFYQEVGGKVPRYYQEIAINRAVQAVIQGQKRVLITMATGTGKTFVAFQIIWKLWKARRKTRILYLADRNVLVDQAKDRTFSPCGDALWKIQRRIIKSREIYFAIYQAIVDDERRPGLYREYPPDFFDLIAVDECHRGSAKDESKWREILEYFSSAAQIGMTATPLHNDNVDTYRYFGNPIFTYSLYQGIEDGFLAPYRVHRVVLNVDATGWRPEAGQLDRFGRAIPDEEYHTPEFERIVSLLTRTETAARHLTNYLKKTDRFAKTIVFCVDQEHAEDMRLALHKANEDLTRQHPHYVARIVSDEGKIGRGHLDDFQDPEKDEPILVTTSQMLTTGVDVPTCRNIVLFKPIGSIVEFKQIIGRGTRLFTDKDKLWFTIIDYTGATRLFADHDFDGYPEAVTEERINQDGRTEGGLRVTMQETTETEEQREAELEAIRQAEAVTDGLPRKFYVDGVEVRVLQDLCLELDEHGRQLRTVKYTDYTREQVRRLYPSAAELRSKWTQAEQREQIIQALKGRGIELSLLAEATHLLDADPFDLLVHVAYNGPLRSRRERAERVRKGKMDAFDYFKPEAREILNLLLEKYTEHGVDQLSDLHILEVPPISEKGTPVEIATLFGGPDQLRGALNKLQEMLYAE
ncbi:MAG: DEAD/DEAH box helicase [Planctomycetes bacterium]|nr:DEAD/DEAH box helicase [Planctomycetota bacterium]